MGKAHGQEGTDRGYQLTVGLEMRRPRSSEGQGGCLTLLFLALLYYFWGHSRLLLYLGIVAFVIVIIYAGLWLLADNAESLEVQKLGAPKRTFYTNVAGVTFRNPDGTPRQEIIRDCSQGEWLELIREPDNRHDSNAIAVRRRKSGEQLGYISSDLAFRMAGEMDSGDRFLAWISEITGGTNEFPTRGVNIKVNRY